MISNMKQSKEFVAATKAAEKLAAGLGPTWLIVDVIILLNPPVVVSRSILTF